MSKARTTRFEIEAEDNATSVFDKFGESVVTTADEVIESARKMSREIDAAANVFGGKFAGETQKAVDVVLSLKSALEGASIAAAALAGVKLGEWVHKLLGGNLTVAEVPGALGEVWDDATTGQGFGVHGRTVTSAEDMKRIRGLTDITEADKAESRRLARLQAERNIQAKEAAYAAATAGSTGDLASMRKRVEQHGMTDSEREIDDFRRKMEAEVSKLPGDHSGGVKARVEAFAELARQNERNLEAERQRLAAERARVPQAIAKAEKATETIFDGFPRQGPVGPSESRFLSGRSVSSGDPVKIAADQLVEQKRTTDSAEKIREAIGDLQLTIQRQIDNPQFAIVD